MEIYTTLQDLTLPVLVTGGVLTFLLLIFIGAFLIPGIAYWFRLHSIQSRIAKFKTQNHVVEFKKVFEKDNRLAHLWKEYQDSLHTQTEQQDGQLVVKAVRATGPAEVYFSEQVVVDSRLRTEFFKHLPGIFTGIGIIGTFSGIIEGLRHFKVSENAATVRESLETLMHFVGEAFVISASAIFLAMLVTFIEKLLLASLYRQTEDIAHAIDAHFVSGAGEEYLSRLVQASEESASQSKILKDALVKELGELLRELTAAQISAGREQQVVLGQTITEGIHQSLKAPLEEIANTVRSASGDQSAAAVRMLQDVMAGFSERLNDLFGGQISGINELNQQTARGIQDAVSTLQTLVANIEASSQRSADAMAQRMAEAVEKMEARQEAMNAQSASFVEQIRQSVASSQAATDEKLRASIEAMGTQVSGLLANLSHSQEAAFDANNKREEAMAARSQSAVNAMSESVGAAIKELGAATTRMAESVASLTQATASSVERMNAGAEMLGTASRNFASAGDRVSGVMGKAAELSAKLVETSGGLTTGSMAMQEVLRDYRSQRDAVSLLVTELRATVETARKEAALTSDVLSRIESSAAKLGTAQKQADEYLEGVSRVLAEAHKSFATEVKRTLDKANTEFHVKLTTAVGMLSAAVNELEVTLALMESAPQGRR